jgi:hypothetical protein
MFPVSLDCFGLFSLDTKHRTKINQNNPEKQETLDTKHRT